MSIQSIEDIYKRLGVPALDAISKTASTEPDGDVEKFASQFIEKATSKEFLSKMAENGMDLPPGVSPEEALAGLADLSPEAIQALIQELQGRAATDPELQAILARLQGMGRGGYASAGGGTEANTMDERLEGDKGTVVNPTVDEAREKEQSDVPEGTADTPAPADTPGKVDATAEQASAELAKNAFAYAMRVRRRADEELEKLAALHEEESLTAKLGEAFAEGMAFFEGAKYAAAQEALAEELEEKEADAVIDKIASRVLEKFDQAVAARKSGK